jgi:hypothetical protein
VPLARHTRRRRAGRSPPAWRAVLTLDFRPASRRVARDTRRGGRRRHSRVSHHPWSARKGTRLPARGAVRRSPDSRIGRPRRGRSRLAFRNRDAPVGARARIDLGIRWRASEVEEGVGIEMLGSGVECVGFYGTLLAHVQAEMTAGNLQIVAERDPAETGDTIGQGLADPALVASAVCASGDHAGDVDVPAGVRGVVVKAERRRRRFPCRRWRRRRERPADRVLRRPARYWRRRRRTTPSSPRRRRPPPRRGRSSVGGPRDPGASDRACARGGRRPARGGSDR